MDIVEQIRPHPLTPDHGTVMISAGTLRAAAAEIQTLRNIVERLANSSKPGVDAVLIALGSDDTASRAIRTAGITNPL